MEAFFHYAYQYADQAHWILFLLIMAAGLNVPISEDVILVIAGAIAAECAPAHVMRLYLFMFFACWLSAWEAYLLGRFLGPKLCSLRGFSRILSRERVKRLSSYYERYGLLTFVLGRFIPWGFRNALFMSSGLTKMPFSKFIAIDLPGCFLSATSIFSLGYLFGKKKDLIIHSIKTFQTGFLSLFLFLLLFLVFIRWLRFRRAAAALSAHKEG